MPIWVIKAALQQVIGRMPNSYRWNLLLQKYINKSYLPSQETFSSKIQCCINHLKHYLKYSPEPKTDFNALELGTGSWPIVPIGLYLCGASIIYSFDLAPLVRRDTLKRTLEHFLVFHNTGMLKKILINANEDRVHQLQSIFNQIDKETPAQVLKKINIHLIVTDFCNNAIPKNSIELIFSTVVLELINKEKLSIILKEFQRIISPNGVMSHYIALADQYASFDASLTPFNFYKYTEKQWRFLNNPIIPQNRLCISDYRELFRRTGWDILEERNSTGSPEDLRKIKLAPKFQKFATEDLLVLYSWIISTHQLYRIENKMESRKYINLE